MDSGDCLTGTQLYLTHSSCTCVKIWSSVDSGDYLTGTQLYLLARHINTSLHLDSQRSTKVLSWFPVLTRQWAAISHFKTTILEVAVSSTT